MDLNRVMLLGNVGADPTFHQMQGKGQLAKFSVATTRKWKDKQSGDLKEDTSWHNIVIFNPYLVEITERLVQKGTRVYIEGELKTRSWDTPEGEKKYITEVIVPQIKGELMVEARGKGWDTNENPGSQRRRGSGSGGPRPAGDSAPSYDDDIPF